MRQLLAPVATVLLLHFLLLGPVNGYAHTADHGQGLFFSVFVCLFIVIDLKKH